MGIVFAAFILFSFKTPASVSYESAAVSMKEEKPEVVHLQTPEPLKGIYMTACAASLPKMRNGIVKLIEETELNAVVIDIKDYTGGEGCQAPDMKEFVKELHGKNIYVIGRVTVFQDPFYAKMHPELAVQKKSGGVWKDRKGISYIDVGAKPFWDYIVGIATSSYAIGFDEINFDYIRYPSDGDMKDIYFAHTGTPPAGGSKKEMLRQFFEYLDRKLSGTGLVTSADLFGMTTTNTDDLGIGQILEYALLNFDYVSPMVYPSHYPPTFNGWPDPNKVPYEIVKYSMDSAVSKTNFLYSEISTTTASSTPNFGAMKRVKPLQLRPWLQDNDYPVPYTAEMVRAQIQATYDAGLTSWMLWDPRNEYTREALLSE